MATTSPKPADGLQTPPPGSRAQLAAAFYPACPDNKPGRLQSETKAVDCAREPAEHELSFGRFRLLPAQRLLLEGDKPVLIGGRAFDLLIALVERPGEVVSKSELIAKVWPQTFVDEGNLKVRIAALRRVLADHQAGKRYISTILGRGYCFVAPITRSDGPNLAAAQHSAVEPLSNIPVPLMQLIGRDEVIDKVSAQLAHHRLITFVGPAGVGKTSVAVATAKGLTDGYEHGLWFVDLTAISDPELLPASVASAIRVDISTENPSDGLLSFLSDKQMLLVLDNCEHIIEAAAALALEVLRAAPCVQILATSREPLGVEGERLHHLKPLEIPLVSRGLSAAQALEFSAVQLFIERAANVFGDFRLWDVDVPMVVDICRRLDGIPLAIELATAAIDALGLRGVVSRLDHPLRLPAIRRRTAVPRHQMLHLHHRLPRRAPPQTGANSRCGLLFDQTVRWRELAQLHLLCDGIRARLCRRLSWRPATVGWAAFHCSAVFDTIRHLKLCPATSWRNAGHYRRDTRGSLHQESPSVSRLHWDRNRSSPTNSLRTPPTCVGPRWSIAKRGRRSETGLNSDKVKG